MNTPSPNTSPESGLFTDFESFKFAQTPTSNPTHQEPIPFPTPQSGPPSETPPDPNSPTPLASELTTLSLIAPRCPLCKGEKYGFTAYFHNANIFSEPPHDLIRMVEKSYVLRNRLKSVLITYAMHDVEQDRVEIIMEEIDNWGQQVGCLIDEVVASAAGFELGQQAVEVVH